MPRSIDVSVPSETADAILQRVSHLPGVVGITCQRGVALKPPGDVVSIQTSNDASRDVLHLLKQLGVFERGSIVTGEPRSIVSSSDQRVVDEESNETTWTEMAFLLRADTNLAQNYLLLMALAGAVAAVGLWTDLLHVVIGAMVIAPAFEPLVRMPFGLVAGLREMAASGAKSTALGYASLAGGAAVAGLALRVVAPATDGSLGANHWVQFWTSIAPTGVLSSTFAALAGAVVIAGLRSVLTTGVMIALALVPSMAIVGLGVVIGDLALAGRGGLRWLLDAVLVITMSALVLLVKRALVHRPGV